MDRVTVMITCPVITLKDKPCKNKGRSPTRPICTLHWRALNPSYYQRQSDRKRFTWQERRKVLQCYGNICYLCRIPIDIKKLWHIDHVIPWSKGGGNELENLRPTHRKCNEKKGTKVINLKRLENAHDALAMLDVI